MKKILSVIIVLAMLLALVPAATAADTVAFATWTVSSSTVSASGRAVASDLTQEATANNSATAFGGSGWNSLSGGPVGKGIYFSLDTRGYESITMDLQIHAGLTGPGCFRVQAWDPNGAGDGWVDMTVAGWNTTTVTYGSTVVTYEDSKIYLNGATNAAGVRFYVSAPAFSADNALAKFRVVIAENINNYAPDSPSKGACGTGAFRIGSPLVIKGDSISPEDILFTAPEVYGDDIMVTDGGPLDGLLKYEITLTDLAPFDWYLSAAGLTIKYDKDKLKLKYDNEDLSEPSTSNGAWTVNNTTEGESVWSFLTTTPGASVVTDPVITLYFEVDSGVANGVEIPIFVSNATAVLVDDAGVPVVTEYYAVSGLDGEITVGPEPDLEPSQWKRITDLTELREWKDRFDRDGRQLQVVVAARYNAKKERQYRLLRTTAPFPATPVGSPALGNLAALAAYGDSAYDMYDEMDYFLESDPTVQYLSTETVLDPVFGNHYWVVSEVEPNLWSFAERNKAHAMGWVAYKPLNNSEEDPNAPYLNDNLYNNLTNRSERGCFRWTILDNVAVPRIRGAVVPGGYSGFQLRSAAAPSLVRTVAYNHTTGTIPGYSSTTPGYDASLIAAPGRFGYYEVTSARMNNSSFTFVLDFFVNTNPPLPLPPDDGEWIRINKLQDLKAAVTAGGSEGAKIVLAARFNEKLNEFTVMNAGVTSGRLVPKNFEAEIQQCYLKLPQEIVNNVDDYWWTVKATGTADVFTLTNKAGARLGWTGEGQNTYFSSGANYDWKFEESIEKVQGGDWHCGWLIRNQFADSSNRRIAFNCADNTIISSSWRFGNYVQNSVNHTSAVDIFLRVPKPASTTDITSLPHNLPMDNMVNLGAAAKEDGSAIRFAATLNVADLQAMLNHANETLEFGFYTLRMYLPLADSGNYVNAAFAGAVDTGARYGYRVNKTYCTPVNATTKVSEPIKWKTEYNGLSGTLLKAALYNDYAHADAANDLRIFDADAGTITFALAAYNMQSYPDMQVVFMPFVIIDGTEYKGVMKYNSIANILGADQPQDRASVYMSFPY